MFSKIIETTERIVIITAGILAVFPLYQYYSESNDRARERLVQEALLQNICNEQIHELNVFGNLINSDEESDKTRIRSLFSDEKIHFLQKCQDIGYLPPRSESIVRRLYQVVTLGK